jgi:putative transposase
VQREQALERFSLIQPFLEGDIPLTRVAAMQQLPLRTLRQWVQRYRQEGLVGLMRKGRSDRGKRRGLPTDLVRQIEGLAQHRPERPIAAIHRQVTKVAIDQGWQPPSYSRLYDIVRSLDQP